MHGLLPFQWSQGVKCSNPTWSWRSVGEKRRETVAVRDHLILPSSLHIPYSFCVPSHILDCNLLWRHLLAGYKCKGVSEGAATYLQTCYGETLALMHCCLCPALLVDVCLHMQVGLAALTGTEDKHVNALMQWRSITLRGIFGERDLLCHLLFSLWEQTVPVLVLWKGSSISVGDFVQQVWEKSTENVALFVIGMRSHPSIKIQISQFWETHGAA